MSTALRWASVWTAATTELQINKGFRLRSVVFLYRLSTYRYGGASRSLRAVLLPLATLYKLYSEVLLGIELPATVRIGSGLRLFHGVGLVVHPNVSIGSHCILRQGVTIGNKGEGDRNVPTIGDYVEFGAGATVIGAVRVGNHVVIGAGTVVTRDIPDYHVVVGAEPRVWTKRAS